MDSSSTAELAFPSREKRIAHEQIQVLLRAFPIAAATHVLPGILLVVLFWNAVPRASLLGWLGLNFLALVAGLIHHRKLKSNPSPPLSAAALWAVIYGSIWGATAVFFYVPDSFLYQVMLSLVAIAQAASATALLAISIKAFYGYVIPILLPFAIFFFIHTDFPHIAMGAFIVSLFISVAYFAHIANGMMIQSLKLQFEKVDLSEELLKQQAETVKQREHAEEAREEAERANMAKSRFLAAASHDLRQPMHALGLFVAALGEKIKYPECRKIMDKIELSTHALESLFNALLDISKLDAGVLEVRIQDFNVRELLERLTLECELPAREKGIRLRVVSCNAVIRSDPALLERIVRNLLSNAVRYTERGTILLGCRRTNHTVRIEVRDTGIGIAQDKLEEIFQEFYQIANPERDRSQGLGLGLAIVQRIANLLDHSIEVRSALGKGSVFSVEVPRGKTLPQASRDAVRRPPMSDVLAGKLIVIIDDDFSVLEAMESLLQNWGCETLIGSGAMDVIAHLAQSEKSPDLIISDYRLRDNENGIRAIELIQRQFNKSIASILVTGDTAPDRLREAAESGYQLLHKPVRPAKLRSLMSHLLK